MINKTLSELENEIINYENALKNASNNAEKEQIYNNFKSNAKFYLNAANNCFKEILGLSPTPFISFEGYNGLMQKGSVDFAYKSKKDYYSEIDTFLNDDRVQKLSEDKKKQVKNSAYILRLYYSDLK